MDEQIEAVTSGDNVTSPSSEQRSAPGKPRLWGIRRRDRAAKLLLLTLLSLYHFLSQPEVEQAITRATVRLLDGIGTKTALNTTPKGGE